MPSLERPILRGTLFAVALALAPDAALANAGSDADPGSEPYGVRRVEDGVLVRRVDEGVADRGPLGLSLREMQVDLALPGGFRGVYRVDERMSGRDDLLFRQSGAVVATFSRSVYRRDKEGNTIIDVPPGTVFSIGYPRWMAETEVEARRIAAAERRDLEVAAIAGARAMDARADLRGDAAIVSGAINLGVDLAMPSGRMPHLAAQRGDVTTISEVDGDRLELAPPAGADHDHAGHASAGASGTSPGVSAEPSRFMIDEAYRRARVARLLRLLDRSP